MAETIDFSDLIPAQAQQAAPPQIDFSDLIPEKPKDERAHGALNAAARGFVDGIPIAGPALLGGIDRADAAVRALSNDTRYADEVAGAKQYDADVTAEHPIAHGAGEVAGGIAGTAPLVAAAPAAFGAGAGGLLGRSAISAFSGGILGGADSAVRSGGDTKEALRGAVAGATLGAAAPGAGQLIGEGVRSIAGAAAPRVAETAGLSRGAIGALAADVGQAGGADAVRARMGELGEHSMLLDAGPALEGRAQGLAAQPATREAVTAPLTERAAGADARLASDVDQHLGPAVSPVARSAELRAQRTAETGPMFAAAFRDAPPVDVTPVLADIGQALRTARGPEQAALQRATAMLAERGPNGLPAWTRDAETIHNTKVALDGLIQYGDPALGIAPGSLAKQQGTLARVRGGLSDALREQTPGYGAAADRSAAYAKELEAIEAGGDALAAGKNAIWPADLDARLARMTPNERAGYFVGVRGSIANRVGTKGDAVDALQGAIGEPGSWNRAKVASVFGDGPAAGVANAVDREAAFAATGDRITGGADDAARRAAAAEAAPRGAKAGPGDAVPAVAGAIGGIQAGATALAGKLAMQAGKAGLNAFGRSRDLARNAELADAVTQQQGEYLNRLLAVIDAQREAAQSGVRLGQAARIGTQAGIISQADRARGYVPLPFSLSTALR